MYVVLERVVGEQSLEVTENFLLRVKRLVVNLPPQAWRVGDPVLFQLSFGRLLDQEVDVLLSHLDEGGQVLGRVDGHVVDLDHDVAQVEDAGTFGDASPQYPGDDNAPVLVLNRQPKPLARQWFGDAHSVHVFVVLPAVLNW